MPRQSRNLGATGWVHIILRGINRENLFYDNDDYDRFRTTVARFQKECGFELPVFCMMSNHVHFLMWDESGLYAQIMKKITVSYAAYYNKKYERVGHVFQDRFRSEPILDIHYFLSVLRYIYQNPQKAGICRASDYSYTILQTESAMTVWPSSEDELFIFLNETTSDRCMEYDSTGHFSDGEVLTMLLELSGFDNPQALQTADKELRDSTLCELKRRGVSIRHLSRLTGINRNIIQRA